MYQVPQVAIDNTLAAYKAASLDGGALGVYINDFTPTPNTVLADFTEPGVEFGSYARVTVTTWNPIYRSPRGLETDTLVEMAGPAAGAGDVVYGWFYVASGGALVASGRFDEGPQAMTDPLASLSLALQSNGLEGGRAVRLSA